MRIKMLESFGILLETALPLVVALSNSSDDICSSFVHDINFATFNASFLNATHHATSTHSEVGVQNKVPFCEIYAAINYAPDARLVFSLWLPDADAYQDRFVAVGGGGLAGLIDTTNMMEQLNSGFGFAVAGGDSGHDAFVETGGLATGVPGMDIPFLQHTDRTEAWIHNAISLFTPLAKNMTARYYGQAPSHMYYNGCSTGGAQAFALAQYHPDLFDGIYAGSPANYYSHLILGALWNSKALSGDGAIPRDQLNMITRAVLDVCDELDGVKDNLIENPHACPFDIETLLCSSDSQDDNDNGSCLTEAQVQAVKLVYQGPRTTDTNETVYPGYPPGSEAMWFLQPHQLPNNFTTPIFQNLIMGGNLSYDPLTSFNFTAAEVAHVDRVAGIHIDEISLDLSSFFFSSSSSSSPGGGGNKKFLTVQGWDDEYLSPNWAVDHHASLEQAFSSYSSSSYSTTTKTSSSFSDSYNLFMVPGGGHCGLGVPAAPATWHVMDPLIEWVEKGVNPRETGLKTTGPPDGSGRSRLLCAWPGEARYVEGRPGASRDDAASYVCDYSGLGGGEEL